MKGCLLIVAGVVFMLALIVLMNHAIAPSGCKDFLCFRWEIPR